MIPTTVDAAATAITQAFCAMRKSASMLNYTLGGAGIGAIGGALYGAMGSDSDVLSSALGGAGIGAVGGLGAYGLTQGISGATGGPDGPKMDEIRDEAIKKMSPGAYVVAGANNIRYFNPSGIAANVSGNPQFYTALPVGAALGLANANLVDRYRAVSALNTQNKELLRISRSFLPTVGGLRTYGLTLGLGTRGTMLNPKAQIPDPLTPRAPVWDLHNPRFDRAANKIVHDIIPDPNTPSRMIANPEFDPAKHGPKWIESDHAKTRREALEEFRRQMASGSNNFKRTGKLTRATIGATLMPLAASAWSRFTDTGGR